MKYIIVQIGFDEVTNEPTYQIARSIQGEDPVYSVSLPTSRNVPTNYKEAMRRLRAMQ